MPLASLRRSCAAPERRRRRRPPARGPAGRAARLAGERIGHAAALLGRDLLQPRPPLAPSRAGASPNSARSSSRSYAARKRGCSSTRSARRPRGCSSRGCSANISRTPSEKRLGIAMRACASRVARSQASRIVGQLVPALRRRRLDDAAAIGPYKRSANRNVGVTGLSASDARVGVLQPLQQQLLDQAARVGA